MTPEKINAYCDAVIKFYGDKPWQKLLLDMATAKDFVELRELFRATCGEWLRGEHILAFVFMFPRQVRWKKPDTLPKLLAAATLFLKHNMFIPSVFHHPPALYRPIPGDDVLCAHICLFIYRMWDAVYREWRVRSGEELYFAYSLPAMLPPDYREAVAMSGEQMLDTEEDVTRLLGEFEADVAIHVARSD